MTLNSVIKNSSLEEVLIEPNKADINYWKDLWRFRELLWFLAWRDILVRYKQTIVGLAWSLMPLNHRRAT